MSVLPITLNRKPAYNVHVESNFSGLSEILKKCIPQRGSRVCIVTDSNVKDLYADNIGNELRPLFDEVHVYAFPAGEASKNLETVTHLYEFLIQQHFDRHDLLVALGGGVVGDLTGFTAATYLRGIDFIQIPTTLLAQVDSSIGGKTGVDFLQYKNMVGAFYMPKVVYINTAVLSTLPDEQFYSGMGEVIKYGLILRDDFYEWLKSYRESILSKNQSDLADMIFTCCNCKRVVVEDDPHEQGIRAILNFGHTIGHAVEKLSGYALAHGQCVAIGMVAALDLSVQKGFLTTDEAASITEMIASFHLLTHVPTELVSTEDVLLNDKSTENPPSATPSDGKMTVESVLVATKSDKKMTAGHIRFILLQEIGLSEIADDVTDDELRKAIRKVLL